MEARLGGADGNLQDGGTFFEGEVVLIVEQEDGPAGGRDAVEKREEGGIGWTAKVGSGSEGSERRVVEGLPAVGAFEVADGDARGNTESQAWKTAGSRKNGSLRKIWIEVS